jgi:hypothetical protein
MEEYAARLLKLVLDKCHGASVSEIRFISGMSPAFVDKEGPHFLEIAYLSKELVGEIHELCRLLADQPVKGAGATSTYAFELRHFGRLLCKYQRRGNIASLILVRDVDAEEAIDATRPKKPPSLRAEAKPRPKRKGR